jgi:glutaconate CoA-transferase subunit A
VFACRDHADYLERIGGDATGARLGRWHDGATAWQALYAEAG